MTQNFIDVQGVGVAIDVINTPELSTSVESYQLDGINYIELTVNAKHPIKIPTLNIEVKLPLIDIHSCWTPGMIGNPAAIRNKGIAEWRYCFDSKISKLAPVSCWYNLNGQNRLAVSLSEATESVSQHVGSYEEERCGLIKYKLLTESTEKRKSYSVTLCLDTRDVPFYEAIQNIGRWYEHSQDLEPLPVPEAALEPVFSTWYNFHQNVEQSEIEEQCKLAYEVGCRTIILDDGWQTDNNNRGYHYCGDWDVSTKRFSNMKEHVERIQSMGMKYMLWLSVPFIGNKSQAWSSYKDYLLFYNEFHGAGVLDPRYKEVRSYLVETYCQLIKEYNFDGFKLDFIDEFDMRDASQKAIESDSARCTESLQEAVTMLLEDIKNALVLIKPDILIEFRQKYIGPVMRKFGNMFRVHDCPHDSIMNRMGVMDLRLLSGNTAVHSDMAIWTPEDTTESASLHFINTLFSVPQISPDLKEQSAEHIKMIKHWLDFWQRHKDILLNGALYCDAPEMQYPIIMSTLDRESLITVHADMVVDLWDADVDKITLVNGAMLNTTTIRTHHVTSLKAEYYDCLGQWVESSQVRSSNQLAELRIPKSGYVVLTK